MKIVNAVEINPEILEVHRAAFGTQKGPVISELVENLSKDPTARPYYSLAAMDQDRVIGHILFTPVSITGASSRLSAQILAPLAVQPEYQNKGIGARLIHAGIDELKKSGVQLVFVLGHPGYYPRCGFIPAGILGYEAPYPIPEEHAGAWMVQELTSGIIGVEKGKVQCADTLNAPEHWRE